MQTIEVVVGNSVDAPLNATLEQLTGTLWDSMWTVYYNHPDHQSVYSESPSGYQYNFVS